MIETPDRTPQPATTSAARPLARLRATRSLSDHPALRGLFRSRWPLFLARAAALAGFVLTIIAGLFGSVVGSHNFAIIFVWIAWWSLLKLGFIPFGGRSWCSVCPLPMPAEWLKQGSIFPTSFSPSFPTRGGEKGPGVERGPRGFGLNLKWPKRLRGAWLQTAGFLAIGLFSAMTLTQPRLTGWVLLGILVMAFVLGLLFERRAFCSHVCPIGGFSGLYAQAAPLEVRVKDRSVCAAHGDKTCYSACPWGVYVTALPDNTACGMCYECLRACPQDNVTVNLRAFGTDLFAQRPAAKTGLRSDETALALVMLGCALSFAAVFLGPWGWLRNAAYAIFTREWLVYSAGFLAFVLAIIPAFYIILLYVYDLRKAKVKNMKQMMNNNARPLLPLGLGAWMAFTVAFAFAKISYVLPVLSDPFGRGWNLFGTAGLAWSPDVTLISPLLQIAILAGTLLVTGRTARRQCDSPRRALAVQAFALLVVLALLVLLLG